MSSSGMPPRAATSRVQLRISLSKSASNSTMAPNLPRTRLARSICCACHACCMKSTTQNRAKDIFSTLSAASQNAPATAPQMLAALQSARSKPRQAVIAGDPSATGNQGARPKHSTRFPPRSRGALCQGRQGAFRRRCRSPRRHATHPGKACSLPLRKG